jgi:hypothetical protein
MHPILVILLAHALQYGTTALTYADKARVLLWDAWTTYWSPMPTDLAPSTRYFLGSPGEDMDTYLTVPPGLVYIEEWVLEKNKKCVVRYAGETIPRSWTASPFTKNPRTPWVWVGDRETEIDLTRTFSKFLVVGNRITSQLVEALIRVTPKTKLIYIQSGTFKELDFPGDGITIEEYGASGSVQNSGQVHRAEETVPAPVVGRRNDPAE